MKRMIPILIIAAIAAWSGSQAIAHAVDHPPPKGQAAGVYLGGWNSFASITFKMADDKMHELNSKPNIYVNLGENPHHSDKTYRIDDSNGFIQWVGVVHIGDFTYKYWADCWFINRKIDCGGPHGFMDWHREMWG